MSKKKGSSFSAGDGVLGCPTDPYIIPYTPEKHDYYFLQDEINFSVSGHANKLAKAVKALAADKLLNSFKVFDINAAHRAAVILSRVTKLGRGKTVDGRVGGYDPRKPLVLIKESIFPRFASRPVESRLWFDIAMLIVGNMNILNEDQIIVQNYNMEYPAWVPFTVTDVVDDKEKPINKRVSFFADAGIFAGNTINKYMSAKFLRFVLSQIGVSRRAYANARDIFGTKMTILTHKEGSKIGMGEFMVSSSQERFNKTLFKVRHGDRPCHLDMVCTCADCIYGTDVCDFAVYKKSEKEQEIL